MRSSSPSLPKVASFSATTCASAGLAVEALDVAAADYEVVFLACRELGANIGRYFRDDMRLGAVAFEHAINQPIGAEILYASHAQGEVDRVAVSLHLARQESFRPEAEPCRAVIDEVHRWRADEGGNERVHRPAIELVRRANLDDL